MGATKRRFQYKCKKQHKTTLERPLGTRFDDHEEIICSECHEPAYLIFAEVVQVKDVDDAKRRA